MSAPNNLIGCTVGNPQAKENLTIVNDMRLNSQVSQEANFADSLTALVVDYLATKEGASGRQQVETAAYIR